MIVRGVILLALLLGGLLAPPASAVHVAAVASQLAPVGKSAGQPLSVQAAKKKTRANLTATAVVLESGKVRVSVASNAKKVRLTYRSAKNKKRTATVTIRNGKGVKILTKGSQAIYAQAKATTKLRSGLKVPIPSTGGPVPDTSPPPAPTDLRVSPGSRPLHVTLNWVNGEEVNLETVLFSGPSADGPWTQFVTGFGNGGEVLCGERGAQCWFALRSVDSSGNASALSSPVSFRVPTVNEIEAEILRLINEARARGQVCGESWMPPVPPLTPNTQLASAARAHAVDMATRDYFDHFTPEGLGPGERARAAGYTGAATENIYGGGRTPADAIAWWLRSPGHCKNLMSPLLTESGVGFADDLPYGIPYLTLYVHKLGRPAVG